jgi:hypothetical protein
MRKTWAEQIQMEAVRGVVFSLLEQRFGALPQRTKRKIERISSLEPLTHLAQRIVVAESIEELGL